MIGIFKQKNPGNTLLLLVYALILKFRLFAHPAVPVQLKDDHLVYTSLMKFLQPLELPAIFYSIITFTIIFLQALLFNRICNAQKILARPTFLPAMVLILITSLFTEWNQFSSALLVNVFLIWIFYRMTTLYNVQKAGNTVFNIGVLLGIISLLYYPAIVFFLLVFFTLFIIRPLHVREWVISILGISTPYYFLAITLYLTDNWNWNYILPSISFSLPVMPSLIFVTISIALLVIPFIIGGYYVQNNLSKMLIQVRKTWSLLLIFLIISLLVIVLSQENNYVNWMLSVVPLTAFHAAAYFYPLNKLFPSVLHWITFAYALYINYLI